MLHPRPVCRKANFEGRQPGEEAVGVKDVSHWWSHFSICRSKYGERHVRLEKWRTLDSQTARQEMYRSQAFDLFWWMGLF